MDGITFVGVPRTMTDGEGPGVAPTDALSEFADVVENRGVILIPTREGEQERFAFKCERGATFGMTQLLFSDGGRRLPHRVPRRSDRRPEILLSFGFVPEAEKRVKLIDWLIKDPGNAAVKREQEFVARLATSSFEQKQDALLSSTSCDRRRGGPRVRAERPPRGPLRRLGAGLRGVRTHARLLVAAFGGLVGRAAGRPASGISPSRSHRVVDVLAASQAVAFRLRRSRSSPRHQDLRKGSAPEALLVDDLRLRCSSSSANGLWPAPIAIGTVVSWYSSTRPRLVSDLAKSGPPWTRIVPSSSRVFRSAISALRSPPKIWLGSPFRLLQGVGEDGLRLLVHRGCDRPLGSGPVRAHDLVAAAAHRVHAGLLERAEAAALESSPNHSNIHSWVPSGLVAKPHEGHDHLENHFSIAHAGRDVPSRAY